MKQYNTYIFLIIIISLFFSCAFPIHADIGVGISGNRQTIVIDKFPYTYENTLWVQNTGDESGIFSIAISGEYADVVSWITISPTVIYLEPNEGTSVEYTLQAREGYGGLYSLDIVAIGYSTGNQTYSPQPVAYMNAQTHLGISIEVTQEAGNHSNGMSHPEESTQEKNIDVKSPLTTAYAVTAPIYMDIPSVACCGHSEYLNAGYIDDSPTPASMKFILYAPSGNTYPVLFGTNFTFDEVGEWIVAVSLGDSILLGRSMDVVKDTEKNVGYPYFLMVCICSIAILLYHLIQYKFKHAP